MVTDEKIIKRRERANKWVREQKEKYGEEWNKKMNERAKLYRERNLDKCRERERNKSRLRRLIYKDKVNQEQREFRKNNPDKVKEYYSKYSEKRKIRQRKKLLEKYGLDEKKFNHLLEVQNNKCPICKKSFLKRPVIDHNHKTGKTRGLLCEGCNVVLGYVEKQSGESKDFLKNFIDYLDFYKQQN